MGRLICSPMAKTTPPFAVPSSLVNAMPVTPTHASNSFACATAFWPVPASNTNNVSCGAVSSAFLMTRTIFSSSVIRCALLFNLPAVSASNTSTFRACAAFKASNKTDALSAPVCWAMTGTLLRSPHVCSCSTAAALNVSPAANMTDFPSDW